MQVPEQVNILGIEYVVRSDALVHENGYIDPAKQEIVLADWLSEEKREQTFLHELVHGILDQLSYEDLYENERLVQGLAVGLHQALKGHC